MYFFLLILKNLRRNRLRTVLTGLAVIALVAIFSMIVNVLHFLDDLMTEKSRNVNIMISERYRLFSPFDRRHVEQMITPGTTLHTELKQIDGFHDDRYTIWHFAIFTIDPDMKNKDQMFFVVATIPEKIEIMTEGLEGFDPRLVDWIREPPRSRLANAGIVMGEGRMTKLGKKVGDIFKARSISHHEGSALRQPIEMDFEIVGIIPAHNRWADATFMDYIYLDRVLKEKKNEFDGKVNYAWLQFDDQKSALEAGGAIERGIRDVKCETSATAYGRFMEPLRDILWGIKFLLVPAILGVMTVILANTFSITVRERQLEMAVLKVLGFTPRHILGLVLGEAALVGIGAGLLGACFTFSIVNLCYDGIKLTGFPVLYMPARIFWWGPAIGLGTALVGGIVPAWHARTVKASEVFAQVT